MSTPSPASVFHISRWKVAGELHNPNGITRNSYNPFIMAKAVFSRDASCMWIRQYPVRAWRVVNTVLPSTWSNQSSIRGKGYTSFLVMAFSLWWSKQKCRLPTVLLPYQHYRTSQGLLDSWITRTSSISFTIWVSSGGREKGTHRGGCLTGGLSPVSVQCSTSATSHFSLGQNYQLLVGQFLILRILSSKRPSSQIHATSLSLFFMVFTNWSPAWTSKWNPGCYHSAQTLLATQFPQDPLL